MSADFAAARLNMVESQVRTQDVTDVRIHDAMREIPRESLLAPEKAHLAYADLDAEYAPGRYLMSPRNVSKLIQALRPMEGERALAICAPYAALVLERLGLSVDRLDENLERPPGGGYDLIVCEASVPKTPESWLAALGPNGRLGVIEQLGPMGKAVVYSPAEGGYGRSVSFDAAASTLAGFEPQAGFAF